MSSKSGLWSIPEIRKFRLSPPFYDQRLDQDDFREIGDVLEAFWEHHGDPGSAKYHAIMVSGKHTNGFVNCSTYLAETNLCEILANQMIRDFDLRRDRPEVVVGPGYAAVTISFEIARQLHARHGFTDKAEDGSPTKIGGRMRVRPGERVLIVNELMSTPSGSTQQCLNAVRQHQPKAEILPYVAVMVNRSGEDQLEDGTPVHSNYKFPHMRTWQPERCPYCAAGSVAIKPKIAAENWLRLTGH